MVELHGRLCIGFADTVEGSGERASRLQLAPGASMQYASVPHAGADDVSDTIPNGSPNTPPYKGNNGTNCVAVCCSFSDTQRLPLNAPNYRSADFGADGCRTDD